MLIQKAFKGKNVTWEKEGNDIYMRANDVADSKTISNWKSSPNTKRYIEALETTLNLGSLENLIKSEEGVKGGTWIHEKLILDFARYISVEFAIWCDIQLATLLREGTVSIEHNIPQTYSEALMEASRLAAENERLESENKELKRKVENFKKDLKEQRRIKKELLGERILNKYLSLSEFVTLFGIPRLNSQNLQKIFCDMGLGYYAQKSPSDHRRFCVNPDSWMYENKYVRISGKSVNYTEELYEALIDNEEFLSLANKQHL